MITSFLSLEKTDFALSDIDAILQRPKYRVLKILSRRFNGFIYIKRGDCRYDFSDGHFLLSEGAIAYLPLKSRHTLTIMSEEIEFYRINFTLKIDGELSFFSNKPLKLSSSLPPDAKEAVMRLEELCRTGENTVLKNRLLLEIFSAVTPSEKKERPSRVEPAVKYLREHLDEPFESQTLASLCHVSVALFYKLFGEEYKMTPLEYKNRLVSERAKSLLLTYNMSVSEVAYMLGFESPAYFSRFFKKCVGVSPIEFVKRSERIRF